mgnify:FL=1
MKQFIIIESDVWHERQSDYWSGKVSILGTTIFQRPCLMSWEADKDRASDRLADLFAFRLSEVLEEE